MGEFLYGLLRSITMMAIPTTMTAIRMAMPIGRMYRSAIDGAAVPVLGLDVAVVSTVLNAEVADAGKYAAVPWKVATTLYAPGMSGFHTRLNAPV